MTKITQKELKDAIVPIHNSIRSSDVELTDKRHIPLNADMFFTIKGKEDAWADINGNYVSENGYPILTNATKESPDSYAMLSIRKGNATYFIKRDSHGHFLNPFGLYSERQHMKIIKRGSRQMFMFSKVNEKAFMLYIKFLQTNNTAWLRKAQREEV